jgi:thiol-disulfide isomerase/thioredoxin
MRRVAALVAVALLALTGCDAKDVALPNRTNVDVDTPALRAAKTAAGVEDCVPGSGAAVDGGLPAITLPCFGGGPAVDLSSLRGPMVVNVWAYWCTPCRKEMPILAKFYADHRDQVAMLGLDYQDVQVDNAMAQVDKSGVTYPLVADPGGELAGHAPFPARMALPMTLFVDNAGKVAAIFEVIRSEQQLVDLVHQYLGLRL